MRYEEKELLEMTQMSSKFVLLDEKTDEITQITHNNIVVHLLKNSKEAVDALK